MLFATHAFRRTLFNPAPAIRRQAAPTMLGNMDSVKTDFHEQETRPCPI